jgi:hypothetical protein
MSLSKNVDPGLSFSISMAFTAEDLQRFYLTGTNIVVAKPAGGGAPNVAWIVYRPLLANQISWEEDYGIYMSTSQVINGATLSQMSATPYPASAGTLYTMAASGAITGPQSPGGTPGSYTIVNQYDNLPGGYLTTGLFQSAVVNGASVVGNAVSAAPVLFQSTAQMTPFTTVYLWTQSQVKSNTVVTNVTSAMTKVTLGGTITSADLVYNSQTGFFDPAPNEKKLSLESGLNHHLPQL